MMILLASIIRELSSNMFKIIKTEAKGLRRGRLQTAHGVLSTPFFMPDATRGFIKLVSQEDLKQTKTAALVVNTFHLYLQPGLDIIRRAGGIHQFMNWSGPLLSDSGGFQVFSLVHKNKKRGKITDEQVTFFSPLDGSRHELSPEKSLQIQFTLGTDMMVCLDDCPPNDYSRSQLADAVRRTILWARRSKVEYDKQIKKRGLVGAKRPLLFAVIQGGAELDLREHCTQELVKLGFDGYGYGARPVDKDGNFLAATLKRTAELIPKTALRFALGVGTPEDIRRCCDFGWDMFDCVIPTREGRHGKLFRLGTGRSVRELNIKNARFASNFKAINPDSKLSALRSHSHAYLHHLFRLNEPLGQEIASLNNLEFYQAWLRQLRGGK
jgi:queuine tRNA-ribosyltransferase